MAPKGIDIEQVHSNLKMLFSFVNRNGVILLHCNTSLYVAKILLLKLNQLNRNSCHFTSFLLLPFFIYCKRFLLLFIYFLCKINKTKFTLQAEGDFFFYKSILSCPPCWENTIFVLSQLLPERQNFSITLKKPLIYWLFFELRICYQDRINI